MAKVKDRVEVPIPLPQMGESVSEATVIDWLKQPGDTIALDELFVTIGTDKVDSDLPSSYEGILTKILVQAGEVAQVGSPLCLMEVDKSSLSSESLEHDKAVINSVKNDEKVERSKAYTNSKSFLSPVVRKIATKVGLELEELEQIQGTGANGRIRKQDILSYLQPKEENVKSLEFKFVKADLNVVQGDKVTSLSRMQNLLAKHLQQSFLEIPHVTTFAEVDVTDIVAHRTMVKERFYIEHATKLTFTHYFQYAIIQALQSYPLLNAWMNVDEIIQKQDINLGFATSLDSGDLIVPNVKAAQKLDFVHWVKKVNALADKAKNGKISNDDIQATTFTVSNTGMFGSLAGTPIISKPQVAVIALGQIISAPGIVEISGKEELAIRKKMMLSISYDHRVINGAYASKFLTEIKKLLHNFKDWFKY